MTAMKPMDDCPREMPMSPGEDDCPDQMPPRFDNMPAPAEKTVIWAIGKGNRDVIGQVEKQNAIEAVLTFLEDTCDLQVKRGDHFWLVGMASAVVGDTGKLMQGPLREGNLVGAARDTKQAIELGHRLAANFDRTAMTPGYGILDAYVDKFYMQSDRWEE